MSDEQQLRRLYGEMVAATIKKDAGALDRIHAEADASAC